MRLNGFLFVQSLPIRPGILTHSQRALDGTLLADSRVRAWLPDGTPSYDGGTLAPELAESWQVASDGMSCTFNLRKDATFHNGAPVTARDVKWSFDRAVKVGGFPTFQMSAGSLLNPEQFVVVDGHTFRIDYVREDKILLFNVAVVVPFIINSELARKNATEAGPWAMNWLRNNEAGGRAYRIESWKPGTETVLVRFDAWKCGPLPKVRRIIALRFSIQGFS